MSPFRSFWSAWLAHAGALAPGPGSQNVFRGTNPAGGDVFQPHTASSSRLFQPLAPSKPEVYK